MIGVLCSDSEREIVQEFFQLFKTPWEFYAKEGDYQVVVSSLYNSPTVDVGLFILYLSNPSPFDTRNGLSVDPSAADHLPCPDGTHLPIYGKLANLRGVGIPLICDDATGEAMVIQFTERGQQRVRVGYDLFQEIALLLTEGQPLRNAAIPAIESHISLLREWIVESGLPLVEIPPIPSGFNFFACLTHDVDFVGIRRHKMDHTMWGFVYRGLLGSSIAFLRGKISLTKLLVNWVAVAKLPFIYAGVADDFWEHFEKYADIEKGFSSTFFLIPFRNQSGDHMSSKNLYKRATHYDIGDVGEQIQHLMKLGFEIGLHGIDAWNSPEKGSQEMKRITEATGQQEVGVRMHWLFYDQQSPFVLEQAGFDYDTTLGYNETIGFRNGTLQVFQPLGARKLLEIPLNIQDTALFYPRRLNLGDASAKQLCNKLVDAASRFGGVLTLSWHERSLEPERLWGDHYKWLLGELRSRGAWIGSAHQIVEWFRHRRSIAFKKCTLVDGQSEINLDGDESISGPPMRIRLHIPSKSSGSLAVEHGVNFIDLPWSGGTHLEFLIPESEKK